MKSNDRSNKSIATEKNQGGITDRELKADENKVSSWNAWRQEFGIQKAFKHPLQTPTISTISNDASWWQHRWSGKTNNLQGFSERLSGQRGRKWWKLRLISRSKIFDSQERIRESATRYLSRIERNWETEVNKSEEGIEERCDFICVIIMQQQNIWFLPVNIKSYAEA